MILWICKFGFVRFYFKSLSDFVIFSGYCPTDPRFHRVGLVTGFFLYDLTKRSHSNNHATCATIPGATSATFKNSGEIQGAWDYMVAQGIKTNDF